MSDSSLEEEVIHEHYPWQYDWKRPQWDSCGHDDDDKKEKQQRRPPLDHAAAAVRKSELERIISSAADEQGQGEGKKSDGYDDADDDSSSSFILTATLLADADDDDKTNREFADILLIEVVKQKQPQQQSSHAASATDDDSTTTMEKVYSRVLRWPESALRQEKASRELMEQNPFLMPWMRGVAMAPSMMMQSSVGASSDSGLVSICLCRLPSTRSDCRLDGCSRYRPFVVTG